MKKYLRNMKRIGALIMVVSLLLISVTACSTSDSPDDENGQGEQNEQDEQSGQGGKIVLADAQWASIQFHNSVAQIFMKEGFGYDTEVISGSTAATMTGLENGDIDVYMEVWIQNIEEVYKNALDSGNVVEVSTNFDDNRQGLYVPTYVIEGDSERGIDPMAPDLKTVKDLPQYKDVFTDDENPSKGRIYGSPPGWEVDNILRTKYETYGLDETYTYFSPGSDAGLAASLGAAYENGDPWLGYYWEPEWVMAKYDLTLLEDEPYSDELWTEEAGYACEWARVDVVIAAYKDLEEKAPDVFEFLSNYQTSKDLTNEALLYMQDNEASVDETAEWFLNEHEDLWISWVSDEVAVKVKEAIQ